MSEFRQDPISGRAVMIAAERGARPYQFSQPVALATSRCEFCAGSESRTPAEISSYPLDRGEAPWQVRVVPNKYPAVKTDAGAFGKHEVIIESPEHLADLTELSDEQIRLVFAVYQDRLHALGEDDRLAYALVFKNGGPNGGATLTHLHSQIIATEFVPAEIQLEAARAGEHRTMYGTCIFCELLADELNGNRIVSANDHFVAFCPYASRFPYEMWVLPRDHEQSFEEATSEQVGSLAQLMRQLLKRLEGCIDSNAYNYWIHTAPFHITPHDDFHWHIEIAPRITRLAGFELGSGCFINPVEPERAAEQLRPV